MKPGDDTDEAVVPEENHEYWANRSGEFSPGYYAGIGQNEITETLAAVLDHYMASDAEILEVGCSSGRHLAHLLDCGYENLSGIDINDESFDVMADHYPRLARTGAFHTGAIEDLLPEFPDDAFDVIYSVETLQHVHPDNKWVFKELARVSSELLITAENEGNSPQCGREGHEVSLINDDFPLYHCDWKNEFSDLNVAQLLCEPGKRDTVRVFRVL
ncbi:class I SAM-dependent methyltransferase [Halopiger djelfimassiliensis]|uniref:class I SAM-dependent methyltransferase n=1 Tax=Halopiger djelfimassiliensis TaxID=1293047 RepID=UPI0009DBAC1A